MHPDPTLAPIRTAALLGLEFLIGLACGAGWTWTMRIWADEGGTVWTTGGWAAAGVWLCGPVLRIGLVGIAAAMGIHQGSAATMLSMAAMLLTCAGASTWCARTAEHTYGVLSPA